MAKFDPGNGSPEPELRVLYYKVVTEDGITHYNTMDAWRSDGKGNWQGLSTSQVYGTEAVSNREGRLGTCEPVRVVLEEDVEAIVQRSVAGAIEAIVARYDERIRDMEAKLGAAEKLAAAGNPLVCPDCGYESSSRAGIAAHRRMKHPDAATAK